MAGPGLEQVMRYTGAAGEFLEHVDRVARVGALLVPLQGGTRRGVVTALLDQRGH